MSRTGGLAALHVPESERRAPSRHRHTTPGSVNHRVATCVREAAEAMGRPMTLGEHRTAYVSRYGALPAAYAARLYQLVRFGILVNVDGRASKGRYAHRDTAAAWATVAPDDSPTDHQHEHDHAAGGVIADASDGTDDAVPVLRALERVTARLGRPVSTREVATELRAAGVVVGGGHPNAVRQRLAVLCAPRTRGMSAWHTPPVRRDTIIAHTGRPSARWSPVSATPATNDVAPASQAEALRIVVSSACRTLGRPVSVPEIRLWLRAHASHPASVSLRGVRLGDAVLHLSKHLGTGHRMDGQLTRIDGEREAGSRAPSRFCDAAMAFDLAVMRARCHLLDLVTTLACADEVREIATIQHRAHRLQSASLTHLARVRHAALHDAMRECAITHGFEVTRTLDAIRPHLETLLASNRMLADWIVTIQAPTPPQRRVLEKSARRVADTARHLTVACTLVAQSLRAVSDVEAVQRVAASHAVALPALAPFLSAAAHEWQRDDNLWTHRALTSAARVFVTDGPVRITAPRQGVFVPRIRLDRVDALAQLYRDLPVARAATLITSATELLGRVVRDIDLVAGVRDASRPAAGVRSDRRVDDHPAVWRAAVVALGLLGVAPAVADWDVARGAGTYDHAAVCLAAVLADPTTAVAPITILAAAGSRVAAVAARRLALRRLMTVVG